MNVSSHECYNFKLKLDSTVNSPSDAFSKDANSLTMRNSK